MKGKQAATIAMTRKLLAMQMDSATIVQLTGLPRTAIQKLQREIDG